MRQETLRTLSGARSGRWMIAPALLVILAIVVYPLAFATYYSLRKVLPNLAGEFVGFANYAAIVRDPDFAEALWTTLLFTAASAGISFLAGLGLALLLSRPFPGRGAVAVAVFLPWVFPSVVVATFGRLALFNEAGVLSNVAETIGLAEGETLVLSRNALLAVAVLADVWRTTPFVALLLLAGIRTIPKDVYDAASVDGANRLQRFFRVTLPLLKPALLVVLLIRLLDAFRVFDLFRVLGAQELQSLSTYVYQNVLLSQLNFGLGSAVSVFVFACALSVSLFFVVVLRAQASTGLAHSGLYGDAEEEVGGHGEPRSGLRLSAIGGLLTILFLAPLVWVFWVSVAFAPSDGAVTGPSLLSYPLVLSASPLVTGLVNSTIIAGVSAALTLLLACPAAYAIARLGLPYANGLLGVMLAITFFPPVAVLVPLLVQLRETGVVGTHLGAIIPDTVFFLPFAIWLLVTFFRELPVEIEDAARVDGASRIQVLTRMIVPLAAPSVFATGAFVFVLSWNELIFASTFTLSELVRPVTVVLADLVAAANVGFPGPLAAASLIAALPPIALFLIFRRRILAGLTGDALGAAAEPTDLARRVRSRTLQRAGVWTATAILLLAMGWAVLLFVRHGLAALAFPYPLNYGEGPLLDQAARLADFRNIYPPEISQPPYAISNYPPLFVLLQAPLVWLFGPEFWYGRAISLAATVAVAGLIALTLHALTKDKIASAVGGLAFLAVPFVLHWSSLSRVDMLGMALSLAGLYAAVRNPGRRGVVLAALFMVAAIYTRQTYALATPLAVLVWLLAQRRRREALAFIAVVGVVSLALLAALTALTGGGFFFQTVTANINEFRWEQVSFHFARVQGIMPILLAGSVAFVALGLRRRAASWWLVGSYLVGATVAALLIGKIGSDVNYLLEFSAALSLAVGALLARYARSPAVRSAMLLALAVQVIVMVQISQSFYAGLQANVISQRDELARLAQIVDTSEKVVLADEYAGLLPLDGRRIYIQPFEFSQLSREGKWNEQPFVDSIRRKEFAAILIFEPPGAPYLVEERWTSRMLQAIDDSYEPTGTAANTTIYRPK